MKTRADVMLVRNGCFASRERAQSAIMEGIVFAGEVKINKPSDLIGDDVALTVRGSPMAYVSRGALKLLKAIDVFHADLKDKTVMDIGASTGGFTEVCLISGAKRVYSIDVGYGQLDWKLRQDPRVVVMERTNARFLTADRFEVVPTVTVMDVSFISIRLIIPVAANIMGDQGVFYTLIKPQFEAGREQVGKKGVVRDPAVHREVIEKVSECALGIGWAIDALDYSPVTGPEGNIEFLARISPQNGNTGIGRQIGRKETEEVVERAHAEFSKTA